jgi:hypothetical protein
MLTKKLLALTAAAAILFAAPVAAQQRSGLKATKNLAKPPASAMVAVPKPRPVSGFENVTVVQQPSVPSNHSMLRTVVEETVGTTPYDLQTNGTEQERVHTWADGEVSVAYTGSTNPATGYPDRGSYYNRRSLWGAGMTPTARLEGTTRTGFTNHVVSGNGTEMTFAHRAVSTTAYRILMSRRTPGSTTWTATDVPTNLPNGGLWCKAAVDGPYVHLLMLTTPSAFSGPRILGMNGHVMYYRSPDHGATWDIIDGVVPGLDSTNFREISSDTYKIIARDGNVAIGLFDSWNKSMLFKSSDNGSTWEEPQLIVDFPLVGYETNKGYTAEEVAAFFNPDENPNSDPTTIETNDGGGTIVFDAIGNVHAFVGRTYVADTVLTDQGTNYYPGTNGLIYWSETAPEATLITGSLDIDGDTTLNLVLNVGTVSAAYGTGLSSMCAASSDDQGGIYLAYSAAIENLFDTEGFSYRHIYMMKSADFGATWSEPIDVIYRSVIDNDSTEQKFIEGVFPSADKQLITQGGSFNFIYQRDFTAGSKVLRDEINEETSNIVFITDAAVVNIKDKNNQLAFGLAPNPTNGNTILSIDLPNTAETNLQVFDVAGAMVRNLNLGTMVEGYHNVTVPSADLNNGIYFIRVQSGSQVGTAKLMVLKQ